MNAYCPMHPIFIPSAKQQAIIARGFAKQHQNGSDAQILISVQVLCNKLGAGSHIGDAIKRAETAFIAVGVTERSRARMRRHVPKYRMPLAKFMRIITC